LKEASARSNPDGAFKRIVFATDFLESSRLALDYAVAFAHHYGARLTIVHAFELPSEAEEVEMISHRPSLSREHASARLEAFAAGVRRLGIDTVIELRVGEPCPSILASAADNNADLLVLGTHGIYRGLQHVLVGSNAEKILQSAPCPTLTVGRHVMAGVDLQLKLSSILFIADTSPGSASVAHYADSLGHSLGIPVEPILVLPDYVALDENSAHRAIEKYCSDLRALPSPLHHDWYDPAFLRNKTASADDIIARAIGCADVLLVLGVQEQSVWKRHLHVSFAFELIARSGCPVLSLRAH